MTRYAVDAERGALTGAWATGAGDHGFTVAVLPLSCPPDAAMAVAARLDRLSQVLWRGYTHPASAAGDRCCFTAARRERFVRQRIPTPVFSHPVT